jgi:hypothetical protein
MEKNALGSQQSEGGLIYPRPILRLLWWFIWKLSKRSKTETEIEKKKESAKIT